MFVPSIEILPMINVALPVFVRVTSCLTAGFPGPKLANIKFTADKLATGAGVVPSPIKATVCGLLGVLSVIRRVPTRAPVLVGENVTLI